MYACMPKEFTWGPGGWPKTPRGGGVFATATPQVFYWAYIYERSTEFKCSLGAWGIGSLCYFFNHEDYEHEASLLRYEASLSRHEASLFIDEVSCKKARIWAKIR